MEDPRSGVTIAYLHNFDRRRVGQGALEVCCDADNLDDDVLVVRHETMLRCGRNYYVAHEVTPKRTPGIKRSIKTTGAIMRNLLSLLCRKFCRARLAEIRKYNLASNA